jgi:hypothetical protein
LFLDANMSRTVSLFAVTLSVFGVAGLVLVGCNQSSSTTRPPSNSLVDGSAKTDQNKPAEGEHPHIAGAHGGIVIPIGSDSYHAEAVIEKDGQFRLLMLGADETRIQEVDLQAVKAYIKTAGETDATTGTPVARHRNLLGNCQSLRLAKRSMLRFRICESVRNDSASVLPRLFRNITVACRRQ